MKKISFTILIMFIVQITLTAMEPSREKQSRDTTNPVKLIWDTDMQWDWDDAGALAILNAMADSGEVEILGIGSSTRGAAGQWNPHTIDIINTYYRRPDIPIGKSLSGPALEDMYGQWLVNEDFPHDLAPEQVWDNTIELYRKLLSEQPDTSVVLVSVGYTSNIADLLMSEPDEYSSLNGKELVEKKVKFWSCMGGRYPSSGAEANFQDWNGQAKYSVDNFPRPILGTSSEAGNASGAGSSLEFTPDTNPVKAIYRKRLDEQGYPNTYSHATWDLIATLVAIRDPNDYFDITSSGTNVITIEAGGEQTNEWQDSPDNGYRYLIQTNASYVSQVLDELIGRAPIPVPTSELKISISGNGSVDPVSGTYDTGSEVTLMATAGICYEFSHWLGDMAGSTNPVTITMNDDKTIAAVFTKIEGCVVPDLVIHWPLNQTSGFVAEDASENNFDLELINTADIWNHDIEKGWNLKLNGTDEYGKVSSIATGQLQLDAFSIGSFLKMEEGSITDWNRIAGITNAYGFNIDENGKLGMWNNYGNNNWHGSYGSSPSLADGQWHHIAMTHDDNDGNVFYVDGEIVLTQNWTDGSGNAIAYPGGKLFKVGTNEGSNNIPANFQDMRIYRRVLSQSEIQKIMNGEDISGIEFNESSDPFKLSAYPNPFNSTTTINYTLPNRGFVSLIVYDLLGKELVKLVDKEQSAGNYKLVFDASEQKSGICFYRLQSGNFIETRKIIVQR